ncbi:MAG: VWA domain-containing protein [Deltaproteobacteria bacterium]|nr:VWA domain-containing protein [Deltaproteobacteria bacterium]
MVKQSRKGKRASLRNLIALCIMAFAILVSLGCVQQELSADKNPVAPGEEVLLTSECIPPDNGDYKYMWFCTEKPAGSQVPFRFGGDLEEATHEAVFTPDVLGDYKIECKVYAGASGFNIASIIIHCIGNASWIVEPTELDFGYVQTDKHVTVENTGDIPIHVSINDSETASFVTNITIEPDGLLDPDDSKDITVTVNREGLDIGEYNTSFDVISDECGSVTINITMMVGPAKILFTVDTSGSMAGTDPDDKRVEAVLETINKFYDNPRVSFGIIDFDSTAQLLTDFTREMAVLESCANALGDDNGWTTYLGSGWYYPGALDVTDDVIDETEVGTHFVTIFLSDGEPTKGNTDHDDIVAKVADIASPDNVKLYTIYLNGDPDLTAEELLNDMAIAGGTEETHVYTDPDSLSFIDLDF